MSIIPAQPRRPRPDFTLNIINVVFLLLLFYLVTGSLAKQAEIEADVPVTANLPLERLPRPLLLVTAAGELFIDGQPVSRANLDAAVREVLARHEDGAFLNILADRSMPASLFLDIVARAGAGGAPLRLVTLRQRLEPAK
ncbi:MAG: biopolymer transporter ExbD [Rhizobiaceae bacterium]|nr:biopolymer transporter ExbD [Rhizobiaceae bacterium]